MRLIDIFKIVFNYPGVEFAHSAPRAHSFCSFGSEILARSPLGEGFEKYQSAALISNENPVPLTNPDNLLFIKC